MRMTDNQANMKGQIHVDSRRQQMDPGSIYYATREDQIVRVAEILEEECEIVRLKNRFNEPLFTGYRDALYNIKVLAMSDLLHFFIWVRQFYTNALGL